MFAVLWYFCFIRKFTFENDRKDGSGRYDCYKFLNGNFDLPGKDDIET